MRDHILEMDWTRSQDMLARLGTRNSRAVPTPSRNLRLTDDVRGKQMSRISELEQKMLGRSLGCFPRMQGTFPRPVLRRIVHVGCGAAPDTLDNWLAGDSLFNVMSAFAMDIRELAARQARDLLRMAHNKKVIAVKNYIHPIKKLKEIVDNLQLQVAGFTEKHIDESVKHYYEKADGSITADLHLTSIIR